MQTSVRTSVAALSLLAVTALSGCGGFNLGSIGGGSSSDYDITTNRQSYTRGNVGEATIRNASDETLEYNLCQRRLEREVSGDWIAAFEWPTAGSACTTEARMLRRGDQVNTFFDIPTGVPSGTYRVVFTGLRNKDGGAVTGDRAATPSFQVR